MDQISRSRGKEGLEKAPVSALLFFLAGLALLLLFGWVAFPGILYVERKQPLAFNHRLHAKIADHGCDSCHAFRPDGSFTGIPGIESCSSCHAKAAAAGTEEARLVREYLDQGVEIPWQVYARQPDSVFFSHAAHVKSAGLGCEACHGSVGHAETPPPYEQNRITGYSRNIWGKSMVLAAGQSPFSRSTEPAGRDMKMDDCVDCHLEANVIGTSVQTGKEGCFVCHK